MILFLDFDGVLHHENVVRLNGKPFLMTPHGHVLFQWVQPLVDVLEEAKHVRVVLSTSWVAILGFDRTKGYLPAEIQRKVIGATWHSCYAREHGLSKREWPTIYRYHQIGFYINRHTPPRWVALDDDDEGWPGDKREHLVHTDGAHGLSDPTVVELLRERLLEDPRL